MIGHARASLRSRSGVGPVQTPESGGYSGARPHDVEMMKFITREGEGLEDRNEDRKATRSEGMGLAWKREEAALARFFYVHPAIK